MDHPVRWYARWTGEGLICPRGHVIECVGPARPRAGCFVCGSDYEILDDAHPDVVWLIHSATPLGGLPRNGA